MLVYKPHLNTKYDCNGWCTVLEYSSPELPHSELIVCIHVVQLACRFSVKANLLVDDEDEQIEELKLYKQAGGGAVCDVTTIGNDVVGDGYTLWISILD